MLVLCTHIRHFYLKQCTNGENYKQFVLRAATFIAQDAKLDYRSQLKSRKDKDKARL